MLCWEFSAQLRKLIIKLLIEKVSCVQLLMINFQRPSILLLTEDTLVSMLTSEIKLQIVHKQQQYEPGVTLTYLNIDRYLFL